MNCFLTAVAGLAVGIAALGAGATTELAPATAPAAQADDGALYRSLAEKVGPALVTLKMVLKFQGGMAGMGDEGRDHEVTGLVIDPKGLVLISNITIGGSARGGITITPTEVKVLFADDDADAEGLSAKMVARDSELDLAWFQIEDDKAKDQTFTAVELSSGGDVGVGDRLFTVRRLDKFFDRTTYVATGAVGGVTKKPRSLVIPSGFQVEPGGPVFGADGKLVGIGAIILPGEEDLEANSIGELYGRTGPLILPTADVRSATARAKELAAKAPPAEEAAPTEPAGDEPAEEPKP